MKHNKLWHDSLHLIIIWPYQRIFAKFIFIFPDTQRPGYYAMITVQFYMMKAQLYFVHDTFCLTNNLFILSRVMMTSSPLQLTVFVKTFEKMRTTYLDRMMAVWRVSDPWESTGWRGVVCLTVWGRLSCLPRLVRTLGLQECPQSCCASPAPSAHAPDNVHGEIISVENLKFN